MTETPLQDRQFFDPDYSAAHGPYSEHTLMFATVAALEYEPGKNAFEAITAKGPVDNKLKAIECFARALKKIEKAGTHEYLGELFTAIGKKKYYTIEDVQVVSQAMSELVIDMFKAANRLDTDYIRKDKYFLFNDLLNSIRKDYEAIHPGCQAEPNKRAERLVHQLIAIDPKLLDVHNNQNLAVLIELDFDLFRRLNVSPTIGGQTIRPRALVS